MERGSISATFHFEYSLDLEVQAADEAGMSRDQQSQAVRVNNVPRELCEAQCFDSDGAQHQRQSMTPGESTSVDKYPIVFPAVIIARYGYDDAVTHALPEALANFTSCHRSVFRDRSAAP